jgi:2-keto-3-deoxy-L-arabinonate dehydratase
VVVQDWNPGGPSVDVLFAEQLFQRCPNFRCLKLEEPGIGSRIRAIRRATGDTVGVFSGWGGLYMLELQPAGACGVMPGLALADVLVRIWRRGAAGDLAGALQDFAVVAPCLQFSLQTFEQFHHVEKRLLVARGVLEAARVRSVTIEMDADAAAYLDRLLMQLWSTIQNGRP